MSELRFTKRAPQEHSYERPRKPLVTQPNGPDVLFIPWYSKTSDYCYYNAVQTACKAAKKKILQLRTIPEERDLLSNPPATIEGIKERLGRLAEDKDKSKQRHSERSVQRSLDFRSDFLGIIHQMNALATILVPVVADANIVIGMMMIIFRV
ncbi:hypothetical protein HOO65_020482 [Ceratocystis lukuohia]|uniref:Uncharacterized protein n=1 Tax=Ceratocystis lukuohia TaxID=2019550 RepID=A0ABR4MNY0_9PEZI